ncbi:O-antigen/teichoic acid export membrane protein [Catenibacillus scindens]|uniref:O-antigen/teichoic acid export membrane protein n=1 Tax=Catenibacillus scindens TaxID=673271 RepID=A0A7W8M6W1_9FIRM|nr:flippase [Catenibacillus scindens]MBB5266379.1 O-antigen/teichoic acid export membrane protein [Catenibacillus scindens]
MESVKKNLAYNIVYQILVVILPLITAPYISRCLGATAVGIYSYTNSVAYYFLLFAMLGISNHGNRCVAAVRDNKKKLSKTFTSIFLLQLTTFLIAIFLYIVYCVCIVRDNKLIAFLQLLYVASGLFDISWLFFGLEQFKITVTRNILIKLFTVICMFIFVHNPNDLWKYTLIMSAGTFLSQLYLWRYVKKYIRICKVKLGDVLENFKPVLILFVPVLAYSIYRVMDKIMLGNMSTYEQVGFYNNAEKIVNIPMGVITALGTVMLPRMSNIIARGESSKTVQYIRLSIKLVTLISSAIAFGLMGVSNVLAPVFFGKDFAACSSIIALLSITVFFISWANVIRTQYLVPKHYDKIYLTSTITGAVVNLLINSLMIPHFGANGAAIGTIFAEFSVMFIQMVLVRKQLPIFKYIFTYIPVLISGVIMMIVVNCIGFALELNIITLVIQIAVGAIFFSIAVMAFFIISKDELIRYNKFRKLKSS